MPLKIAFIKIWEFSLVNQNVFQQLTRHFPESEIEVTDVRDLIRKRKDVVLLNLFYMLKEYGLDIALGKKNFRSCFFITSYIFKQIKKLIGDHIVSGNYLFSFQTQSLFDASVEGIPHFVYTDHTVLANLGYPNIDKKRELYSRHWIELEKTIYQNAALVFTTSDYALRSIVNDYMCDPGKVVCVYSGINVTTNFIPGHKSYDNQNILFVGVEWERKGGPELVEAFKLVLKVYPNARLTIVGCSPEVDVPNCEVVGLVTSEVVPQYYRQASVFCLPSKKEPSAVAITEAAAYGLPVVSTAIGGTPERVVHGKTGYLVKPGDVEELAHALIELIGNPQKCQMFGEEGYRQVIEKFSWQTVASLLKQNIVRVLNHA